LDFEQYKSIKKLVGIAGGPEKFEAVKASLIGNLLSVLITDSEIGRRLVEQQE